MNSCSKPCPECPYRKTSLRGWLGESWSNPQRFLTQLDIPQLHPCHMSVEWDSDEIEDEIDLDDKPICAGAIHFMNNSFKRSRYPEVLVLQEKLGKSDEVFKNTMDFIQHHQIK